MKPFVRRSSLIHLLIVSVGSGKTTYGRALAKEIGGVYFAIDDWMKTICFADIQGEIEYHWMMQRIERVNCKFGKSLS